MNVEVDKVCVVKTKELLKITMKDNDFCFDIYFRMAVIDEYLKGNDNIWHLYNSMQCARVNEIGNIISHMMQHKNEFINLIESIKNKGYDMNFPIFINDEGVITDGAHRMAAALYFGIENISILLKKEYKNVRTREYSEKWFRDNDLYECIVLGNIQKNKVLGDSNV